MEILVIGKLWPEPTSSAAGKRMMQLIELLSSFGQVNFACPASKSGNEANLELLSVKEYSIKLNCDSFNVLLESIQPEIVVFDRFMTEEQFSWRVAEICPSALRILNTEDLHFLRNARKVAVKLNQDLEWYTDYAMRELAAISRSDLSLIISEVELNLLIEKYKIPEHLLIYLPIFSTGILPDLPSFEERKDSVFIGNFLHEPNSDAVRFLKNEIWGLIKHRNKNAQLHVYGSYPSKEILDFHNEAEGFIVHGRCEDAQLVTKFARLSFAPLRFGAGIKGKLLEAMECGTPSITTAIGAEGITNCHSWPGKVVVSAEEFAEAFFRLYDSKDDWLVNQRKGEEVLKNHFKKEPYCALFEQTILSNLANVSEHRNKHFVSKLIWHQTLQGTKYMSKWIMEKKHATGNFTQSIYERQKEEGD